MYFFHEGSHKSQEPNFIKFPPVSKDVRQNQPMFFPEIEVAKWFFDVGMAEKQLILSTYDNLIDSNKNFIDIGSHVGTYSWMIGKKAKHTFSFECSPTTFCFLCANIALHNLTEKVTPFPFALGNDERTIDYIVRSADGGGNGVKSLSSEDNTRKKIPVMMKTLDSFHFDNIGLIKIDVEGFEKEVLMGGLDTLKRNNYPRILFESWGDWKNKEGVQATKLRVELFDFLKDLGYKIISVSGGQDMYLAEKTC